MPKRRPSNPASTANLDKIFSRLIRGRDLWTCQKCGAEDPDANALRGSNRMDCSHLVGRTSFSTRWHPLAAVCHCVPCHRHLGDHPLEFAAWIEEHLGAATDALSKLAAVKVKWTDATKKILAAELALELERLKNAEAGHGEFFGFELATVEMVIAEGLLDKERLGA